MSKKEPVIPLNVQEEIVKRVDVFNKKKKCAYTPQIKGKFVHLLRGGGPICRCTYTGDIEKMGFAIYKYSSEKYDPNEWFFPGAECVDGTVEGAMKAGLKAY